MALTDQLIEDIDWTVERARPVTLRTFDPSPYRDRVPESLDLLWRRFGVSNWAGDSLQLIDPAPYITLVADLLSGNAFIRAGDVVPYSLTAFGLLRLWHRDFGHINVDFPQATICFRQKPAEPLDDRRKEIDLTNTIPDAVAGDHYQLLEACKTRFGPIGEGEIYGFVPALALGGVADIDHVEKLAAPEHLSLLGQMAAFGTFYRDVTAAPGAMFEMR